jgi:glycosyltransferase involved in cell wall biosynthesis
MRILHVAQPVEGGVAAVVFALAHDQCDRGWDVTVACPPQGLLPDLMRKHDIALEQWTAVRSPNANTFAEIRSLARIIRKVQPDAVHLHGSKAGLAGRLAIRGRRPTLFQPHLWSFQAEPGPTIVPARIWERLAARWTHRFVCVSDDEHRDGLAAGVTGRFAVIYNGVDVEEIRPRDRAHARAQLGLGGGPIAVCVARLAPLKGQDILLTAWPDVLREVPTARLLLVGDGPTRLKLHAEYPISADPSVLWIGNSSCPSDYMAAADVVVVPSRAEGMALVPLEAMASGRSLVAFDAGGIRQSVGDGGVVLPIGDIDAMAREIVRRLTDPSLAREEGKRGRRIAVSRFDHRLSVNATAELVLDTAGALR